MEERSPVTFVQTFKDSDFHKGVCSGLMVENNILNKVCSGNSPLKSLKRKSIEDEEMLLSPLANPFTSNNKKPRMVHYGRSFPIARLLEHLDGSSLRNIIQTLVDRYPTLSLEIANLSSRPDLSSVISILNGMEEQVRRSFPYGGDPMGEYAYNRIRPILQTLIDALLEYTCIFLPPYESNRRLTLTFLDHITSMLHRFPEWNNPIHNYSKEELYDEISNAWISAISSISKECLDGINGNEWIKKLIKHNEVAGGRFKCAVNIVKNKLSCFSADKDNNTQYSGNNKLGVDFAFCYQL